MHSITKDLKFDKVVWLFCFLSSISSQNMEPCGSSGRHRNQFIVISSVKPWLIQLYPLCCLLWYLTPAPGFFFIVCSLNVVHLRLWAHMIRLCQTTDLFYCITWAMPHFKAKRQYSLLNRSLHGSPEKTLISCDVCHFNSSNNWCQLKMRVSYLNVKSLIIWKRGERWKIWKQIW